MGRQPTDRRYDHLLAELCVRYGFCGGVKDGVRRHVNDFIPASGRVTADEFARWAIQADERDAGVNVVHGGLAGILQSRASPESFDERWRRTISELFIRHMGASEVDASCLRSADTIMANWLDFRIDDLSGAPTQTLVRRHLEGMRASSPVCSVHAFDVDRLRQPGVTFWSGWLEGEIAVIGALKRLDDANGEIKSMRVSDAYLGRNIGRAMLDHIIREARRAGLKTLWLETGSTPAFDPALKLYESAGFTFCGPFADYTEDPFSRFMTLAL